MRIAPTAVFYADQFFIPQPHVFHYERLIHRKNGFFSIQSLEYLFPLPNHNHFADQACGLFPKYLASLKAVSAVILLFPLTISEILVFGILIPLDKR
jgi:hypothetical protein